MVGGELLHSWSRPVRPSSGYRPMSVVSASFWHATGTARSPLPGVVSSQPPGLVSSAVHTCEDQRDQQNDDEQDQPSAGEAGEAMRKMPLGARGTGQHYPAPAE